MEELADWLMELIHLTLVSFVDVLTQLVRLHALANRERCSVLEGKFARRNHHFLLLRRFASRLLRKAICCRTFSVVGIRVPIRSVRIAW